MRLIALRLSQFRQFSGAAFEFGAGLNVVHGGNGTGKSTLLEGVLWALCGTGSVRRSERSLRRLGAPDSEPTACELEFAVGDASHTVRRTLLVGDAPAGHDAVLFDAGGSAAATGEGPVTAAVAGLLGADRDLLLHACFTGRKELQQLAQLKPAERLRLLARLLGRRVTRPHGAEAPLAEAIRALEHELTDATERMRALASAPDLHAQYTAELEQLRRELAAAESLAGELHSEWSQKRQDVDTRLETYRRRDEELRRQIDRLAAADGSGACPTCGQPLGSHLDNLVARLDDEFYAGVQDMKWLAQRQAQLARKPPDLAESETRRTRLRAAVDDRAERAARCEQAMQELWTVASERKRTAERLEALRRDAPAAAWTPAGAPLVAEDLSTVAAIAGAYLSSITDGRYDRLTLEADGRVHAHHGDTTAPVVSGGDEDLIALVLRLATMREAATHSPQLDVLLLDEPFGSLDAERVERAAALLGSLCAERPQIVVATRGDALCAYADVLIEL
jgi:DNA repair exonuclease SbcCD ATPase subunit